MILIMYVLYEQKSKDTYNIFNKIICLYDAVGIY